MTRHPFRFALSFLVLACAFAAPSAHADRSRPARDSSHLRGAGANPRNQKEQALARLEDLRAEVADGAPGVGDVDHALEELDDAIEQLEQSLAPELWLQDDQGNVDPQRLDPEDGHQVFHHERHTAQESFDAIRQGKIENEELRDELLSIVDVLVAADRRLAEVALEDAQSVGGDADEIDEAADELDQGDELVGDAAASDDLALKAARLYTAMDGSFRHAWDAAIDAVDLDG